MMYEEILNSYTHKSRKVDSCGSVYIHAQHKQQQQLHELQSNQYFYTSTLTLLIQIDDGFMTNKLQYFQSVRLIRAVIMLVKGSFHACRVVQKEQTVGIIELLQYINV